MFEMDPTRVRREGTVLARDRFDAVVDEYDDVKYDRSAKPDDLDDDS